MVMICACGALLRARSARTRWQTTISASAGTLSTLELVTISSGRSALMRLWNLVAPIALDPMPASHEKTILCTSPAFIGADSMAAGASPLACAFMSCILACASLRFCALPEVALRMTDESTNDTAAARTTPINTVRTESRGAIAM